MANSVTETVTIAADEAGLRLDRVLAEAQREWARFLTNVRDDPVPRPPQRYEILGA